MTKPNKLTKTYLKKLERRVTKKAFKEWALAVKERDGFKCTICGRTDYLDSHHIIGRENKELRFNVDNGITLDKNHHRFSREISPHKNPFVFFEWFREHRKEQYKKLLELIK